MGAIIITVYLTLFNNMCAVADQVFCKQGRNDCLSPWCHHLNSDFNVQMKQHEEHGIWDKIIPLPYILKGNERGSLKSA